MSRSLFLEDDSGVSITRMASHKTGTSHLEVNIEQNFQGKNIMVGDDNTLIEKQNTVPRNDETNFPALLKKNEDSQNVERKTGCCKSLCQGTQGYVTCRNDVEAVAKTMGARPKQSFSQVTQNIQAKKVVNVISISNDQDQKVPELSNIESEIKLFLQSVRDFKYGHLILVADHMEPDVNIQSIGLVPWTFIFDFDQHSRSGGLLSQVETVIKGRRSLHISTWQEKCSITDQSCHWMFLKGTNEQPDSKTKTEFAKWKKQTKSGVEHITDQLEKFGVSCTEYYVVVFWPDSENISLHVKHIIDKLEEINLCKYIIITDKEVRDGGGSQSVLRNLQRELPKENQPTIINLGIADICMILNRHFVKQVSHKISKYVLPKHNAAEFDINDQQAQWLGEGLEVLYEEYPYGDKLTLEELQKQSDDFYRGGNWPWHMWYKTGAGNVDIERDIMKSILDSLRKYHIDVYKSGLVTLCHAPGSGGTTLAQRILWELHSVTPCAQVKGRISSSDVASRAEFLYDKTKRPVLLLLDGEDEQRIQLLMRDLREICCVILYVKRYPYPINDKRNSENRFWLQRFVSKQEAAKIAYRYLQQCDKESKKINMIKKLQKDVELHRSDHGIFEFGLATYRHEYKGIESYVKGFLQLEDTKACNLLPWQRALAILSLVYYYGQMGMPCKFFSEMLQIDCALHQEDLPVELQALIVCDTSYRSTRTTVVRISHYLVAKEVLEQVLSRPKPRGERTEELCPTAREKLEPFALSFIKLAGRNASEQSSNMMLRIMTRTFICRDNKAAGETDVIDTRRKRKFKFAPILIDAGSRQPFTERFNILKELTRSFPQEPQFQAHLGRLYSLCRPEDEASAEECFKKALQICDVEISGMSVDDIHHTMRLTLMHIYHMYGNMFLTRVSKYTGKYLGDKPKRTVSHAKFEQTTRTLFQMVVMTCEYFSKCRDVTPLGLEDAHGFIGEIIIRLMFCDFVHRKYQEGNIYDFMSKYKDYDIAGFVADCVSAIDGLILECLSVVDPDRIEGEMLNLQTWFASLFRIDKPSKVVLKYTSDNLKHRRIQIAARKLLYEKKKVFGVLEEVTRSCDIHFIVKEYEKNFEDIHENGIESSRQAIDLDYREWIFAIRHKLLHMDYPVEDVLRQVRLWHEKVKTPNSRFYLFILCSLLGFGCDAVAGNTQLLIEAKQLKDELLKQSKYVAKPKYPREWLGTGQGIRRLTPGTRFFGWIEGREIKVNFDNDAVETRVGTIQTPNDKPASGYISLDLGEDSVEGVTVFYVPVRSEMKGPAFAGARVAFFLGFSMAHGYEAYNVRPLKTAKCKTCRLYIELKTIQTRCRCGEILKAE